MYTLQNTINWAQTYIEFAPITQGVNFEPAISIATMIRNTILTAPFTWPFNRNEYAINIPNVPASLTQGVQDYTFPITDFAYLEKLSLLSADESYGYELKDVYNTYILGIPASGDVSAQAQPNGVSVKFYNPGTSVSLRFLGVPDQAYTGMITYQKMPIPFQVFNISSVGAATGGNTIYNGAFNVLSFPVGQPAQVAGFGNAANNGSFNVVSVTPLALTLENPNGVAQTGTATVVNESWYPIPDSFSDIYNNLFLAEAMGETDDVRAQQYRQRGIATLLAKSEGLSDLQVNAFLAQWMARDSMQRLSAQLRKQQSVQARGV